MRESKAVQVKVDGDGEGSVVAAFSTLKVLDKDGDITDPGAFKNGQEVLISDYNHGAIPRFGFPGRPPVGKGSISEKGDSAIMTGKFFLDTTAGLDAYKTTKAVGDLQEWSYYYDVLDAERKIVNGEDVRVLKSLDVFEVSPVYRGAGEGTRTMSIKYSDDFQDVLEAVHGIVKRTKDRKQFRNENNRDLSSNDRKSIAELSELAKELQEMILESGPPEDGKLDGKVAGAVAQFELLKKKTEGILWQEK